MEKSEFYNHRAERYTCLDKEGQIRYLRALEIADKIENQHRVLDVGCKHAYLSEILNKQGINCNYYGIDISEKVIESLKNKQGTFKLCDITHGLPFEDDFFDSIVMLEVLEHVENPTYVLTELHRVLSDNGQLLISVPNPYSFINILSDIVKKPETEGHIHSFTFRNLDSLFRFTNWKIEKKIGTYCIVPYTWHGLRDRKFLRFKTSSFFLATSYVYKLKKND
ncbi:MAG: class I SAM-dependent methyltransferase [Phycisphaerae bacterium]|nr:class I SAM-dependent methyltransferase [Phycisphaerae bacterium]